MFTYRLRKFFRKLKREINWSGLWYFIAIMCLVLVCGSLNTEVSLVWTAVLIAGEVVVAMLAFSIGYDIDQRFRMREAKKQKRREFKRHERSRAMTELRLVMQEMRRPY